MSRSALSTSLGHLPYAPSPCIRSAILHGITVSFYSFILHSYKARCFLQNAQPRHPQFLYTVAKTVLSLKQSLSSILRCQGVLKRPRGRIHLPNVELPKANKIYILKRVHRSYHQRFGSSFDHEDQRSYADHPDGGLLPSGPCSFRISFLK